MIMISGEKMINEKEASSQYGLSIRWFRRNRYSANKIPFHRLNSHIYYKTTEVDLWFKNNMKRFDD